MAAEITIPVINRFMYMESQLAYGLKELGNRQIIPILDYAVEGKSDRRSQNEFSTQFRNLVQMYGGHYHALKPSSVGFRGDRINELVETATRNGCRVLVDAEEDASHKEVCALSNGLLEVHNEDACNVFKTYQMYRKDSLERLEMDLYASRRDGWWHGVKLVRGAYLKRDKSTGMLYTTKEETDESYNKAVQMLLNEMKGGDDSDYHRRLEIIFATHNEESVDLALAMSRKLRSELQDQIYFATLMGMGDSVTRRCLDEGRQVMKYVPFGPVPEMLPYLMRRLDENRDIFKHIQQSCIVSM